MARAKEKKQVDTRVFWLSLGLTGLLAGGVSLVCILWPTFVITLFFGAQYQDAAPLLQIVSAAMALLAVANVVFTYGLARSNFTFLWPLTAGCFLMCLLIFMFHSSALTIAWMLLFSIMFIFIGTMGYYLRHLRPSVVIS